MNQFVHGVGILLPFTCLVLIGCLSIAKLFLFIRRKFPTRVNCWFCNKSEKLSYDSRNSFNCSSCGQYNGFTKDGDYNRPIPEMHYSKLNPVTNCVFSEENVYGLKKNNGLCYNCNRNQELLILQLASFVPDNEECFDEEVEKYRQSLEKSYRLCAQCERVVKRSLNQVKSHIVGSKKSGEKLHNTVFVPPARKMELIKFALMAVFVIALVNFWMSMGEFHISADKMVKTLGKDIAESLLSAISYVLAVKSLMTEFLCHTLENPILQGARIYLTEGITKTDVDWGMLDLKEFLNISTMLVTVMLIILFEGHNLGSQLALLFFCSLKTLLHNHEMLLEPIETEFLHGMDLICAFMALILSYRGLGQTKMTFKCNDDLNKSFHKICPEVEEESDEDLDETMLNSTLKSTSHASFYAGNHFNGYSRTPSVISTSFKSPSEMNFSRLSSKQVMDNVGKLTQLNINKTFNVSGRSFNSAVDNPFYSHMNLDRQTPSSVLSYRPHAIISPPKLNRDPVQEASWLAGGFWTTSPKRTAFPSNSDFMPIMSRTSSQSSGFESQQGAGSRENSVEKNAEQIRPIRPQPLYATQEAPATFNNTFTKPPPSRASFASRQSNRSIFGEASHFNDTSSLYSYRSNGRFVTPASPNSRSIFNFKKFSTDLPQL